MSIPNTSLLQSPGLPKPPLLNLPLPFLDDLPNRSSSSSRVNQAALSSELSRKRKRLQSDSLNEKKITAQGKNKDGLQFSPLKTACAREKEESLLQEQGMRFSALSPIGARLFAEDAATINKKTSSNKENKDSLFELPSLQGIIRQERTILKPQYPVTKDYSGLSRRTSSKVKPLESIKDPFLKNTVLLLQKSPLTCKSDKGEEVALIVNNAAMTGQHCVIASIAPGQPAAVTGFPNAQVLFKTFRDYCILTLDDEEVKIRPKSSDNVLDQYDQMNKCNVPVMKIYNYERARGGCGYFLVEYVPNHFDMTWKKGAKISELDAGQKNALAEVRQLFELTYQNGIHADLQPNNLRRRNDGTLVFIDLREDKPDDDEFEEEMKLDFAKMLRMFNCEENDEIYKYLSANLKLRY